MKYKKLTKEQIILSLDRLTRFKNTKMKYLRVFSDILASALIEPKIKKSDIEDMDFSVLADYVTEIINYSLDDVSAKFSILSVEKGEINKFLRDYENSIFVNDDDTQKLLNNNIDFIKAIEIIPDDCPVNLKWLVYLVNDLMSIPNKQVSQFTPALLHKAREQHLLKFPVEKIILVEGITEEILLPTFAKYLGYDFYAKGIQVIAAGGKNQVVKMYYKLAEELKIPIFVLLDKDAEDNIRQIKPRLRENDKIHLVSCGEFEDLLPKSLIIKTVNSHFKNFLSISEADFNISAPTAKILEEIFKTKGLHVFKKAEFAKLVREEIVSDEDISEEIRTIVNEISLTNKMLDTEICS